MTHHDINIIHSRNNAIEPIIKFTFVLVNDIFALLVYPWYVSNLV